MQSLKTKKRASGILTVAVEILAIIFLILILAVFVKKELLPASAPVPTPEPALEVTPTPTPDYREYRISVEPTGNDAVDESISAVVESVRAEFDGKFDGLEPETLTVEGRLTECEQAVSLILHVSYTDEDRLEYHVFSAESGEEQTLEDIYGENIGVFLADYFETVIAVDEQYAEKLSDSFAASTGADSEYYRSFILDEDGLLCIFFPAGTVLTDDEEITFIVPENVSSGEYFDRRRIDPEKPMVALTFDDGPHEIYTDQILEILKENKAAATFFEVGVHVEEYPEVEQRIVEAGCEIGSHTYWHTNLSLDYGSSVADIQKANAAFEAAIGYVPTLVRPPEGVATGPALGCTDQIFIGWSIDTLDWLYKNPTGACNTIKQAGDLDGQVILFHSIYETSVTAVAEIVPWLVSEGYQLVTISELFEYCYKIVPESHYYYAYDFFINGRPITENAESVETPAA